MTESSPHPSPLPGGGEVGIGSYRGGGKGRFGYLKIG